MSTHRQRGPGARAIGPTNLERVGVGAIAARLDGVNGPGKQVPRLHVQVQDVGRPQLVEEPLEGRAVGPQEEELGPEAVGLFGVIALVRRSASWSRHPCRPRGRRPRSGQSLSRGREAGNEPAGQRVSRALGDRTRRQRRAKRTLNSDSYSCTILGWNTSGGGCLVSGDGSISARLRLPSCNAYFREERERMSSEAPRIGCPHRACVSGVSNCRDSGVLCSWKGGRFRRSAM